MLTWIGLPIEVAGILLCIKKNNWCWPLMATGELFFLTESIQKCEIPNAIVFGLFMVLDFVGWRVWRKV